MGRRESHPAGKAIRYHAQEPGIHPILEPQSPTHLGLFVCAVSGYGLLLDRADAGLPIR